MSNTGTNLGKRLQSARKARRMTQEAAATCLGISNGTLSGYERNYRKPDPNTLIELAKLYDVEVSYLLGQNSQTESFDNNITQIDIVRDLTRMIGELEKDGNQILVDGNWEALDKEDKTILVNSLENSLRLTLRLVNQSKK